MSMCEYHGKSLAGISRSLEFPLLLLIILNQRLCWWWSLMITAAAAAANDQRWWFVVCGKNFFFSPSALFLPCRFIIIIIIFFLFFNLNFCWYAHCIDCANFCCHCHHCRRKLFLPHLISFPPLNFVPLSFQWMHETKTLISKVPLWKKRGGGGLLTSSRVSLFSPFNRRKSDF